jgi:hypothetical protein
MEMVIYIFEKGEYSRKSTELVTTDVKKIAKLYAEVTNSKNYSSSCDAPNVQIWKDENHVRDFWEFEKDETKIVKILSKYGQEITK